MLPNPLNPLACGWAMFEIGIVNVGTGNCNCLCRFLTTGASCGFFDDGADNNIHAILCVRWVPK